MKIVNERNQSVLINFRTDTDKVVGVAIGSHSSAEGTNLVEPVGKLPKHVYIIEEKKPEIQPEPAPAPTKVEVEAKIDWKEEEPEAELEEPEEEDPEEEEEDLEETQVLDRKALEELHYNDVRALATEMGLRPGNRNKKSVIDSIIRKQKRSKK